MYFVVAGGGIGEHVAVSANLAHRLPQAVVEAHFLAVLGIAGVLRQRQQGRIMARQRGKDLAREILHARTLAW